MAAETRALAGLPATLEGLTTEKAWIETFRAQTAAFKAVPSVARALADALADALAAREARLEAAYPGFEAALEGATDAAQVDALLARYLALPGDADLPIALEYQLSAELRK